MHNDTIYALATPLGNGIAVIRVSGSEADKILRAIFTHKGEYKSHMLYYGSLMDGDELIDEVMAVIMRAPKSYTAEDCLEIHCHGSYAIARRIMELLSKMGLRQAERGEFTKRAFMNGRLKLSEAEAVIDLIHSSAQQGAKEALKQLGGSLSRAVAKVQDNLTDCIARIEAGIDYPEEDWESEIADDVRPDLNEISSRIDKLIQTGRQGRIIRDGLKIALVGRPNVGKSSLLNALLGEYRAIVTDIPGTTRDVIEEAMDWDGIPVRLIDTAGLRETNDKVEQIGVNLTKGALKGCDLALVLLDGSCELFKEDYEVLELTKDINSLVLISKGDLEQMLTVDKVKAIVGERGVISACAIVEGGLDALKAAVKGYFNSLAPELTQDAMVTNVRHIDALKKSKNAIDDALSALGNADLDCVTIDLRESWNAMGEISGVTVDDEIIDRIFSKFCLGK